MNKLKICNLNINKVVVSLLLSFNLLLTACEKKNPFLNLEQNSSKLSKNSVVIESNSLGIVVSKINIKNDGKINIEGSHLEKVKNLRIQNGNQTINVEDLNISSSVITGRLASSLKLVAGAFFNIIASNAYADSVVQVTVEALNGAIAFQSDEVLVDLKISKGLRAKRFASHVIKTEADRNSSGNLNNIYGDISIQGEKPDDNSLNLQRLNRWSLLNVKDSNPQNNGLQFWEYFDGNGDGRFCDDHLNGQGGVCNNRMTLQAHTGNLGIGTHNPHFKLEVMGDISSSGKVYSNGVEVTSDRRYKKEITSLKNSLEMVLKLRGVSYKFDTNKYKEKGFDSKKQIGLIAQEVEKILPELVSTNHDGYKSINYAQLSVILIEAIKAQNEKIQAQEARQKNINDKLASIERRLTLMAAQKESNNKIKNLAQTK